MKKQFAIKPVQILKTVVKSASQPESNNLSNRILAAGGCCENVTFDFHRLSKPVFSL